MFLTAAGLRSHIWNNNLRSVLLLAGFPVLLVLMGLALTWLTFGLADPYAAGYGTKAAMPDLVAAELARLPSIAAWSLGLAAVWFVIAWFFHQSMINAATGARRSRGVRRPASGTCWRICAFRAASPCPNWR